MDGLTVLSNGTLGQVLIQDARDEGAIVILVCKPWDGGPPSGIPLPSGQPESQKPPEPEDLERKYKGIFPMLRSLTGFVRPRRPTVLTIDTSGLPSGPLGFRLNTFLQQVEYAGEKQYGRVTLNLDNAKEWGLVA